MPAAQGTYWIGTLPEDAYVPSAPLPIDCSYLRGQLEEGHGTAYRHWQVFLVLSTKKTLGWVLKSFPGGHWELTRSKAADAYVWKEDTRVEGSQFELGSRPLRRNCQTDWDMVRLSAQQGNLVAIPADIYVRCYNQLSRIAMDHFAPVRVERTCHVFWGPTATGKSRRAWAEAGDLAYSKDPCTKWWCGYQNQQSVIIDEFRGLIGISHMLRWLDRYPVSVETKGSARPLLASTIWITSNVSPEEWYPDLDEATRMALLRRLLVEEFK